MKIKSFFRFDILLFISSLMLITFGILFIYSSGITSTGKNVSNEYIHQIVWAVTGLILFFLVMFSDYSLFRRWSYYLYFSIIMLLLLTLLFGRRVNGARSWLGFFGFGIQPSEFGKIAVMMILADFYEKQQNSIEEFSTFTIGFIITLIPVLLILLQPDMGTSLVYIPIFITVSFIAGVKKRYLLFLVLSGSLMILLGVIPSWAKIFTDGDVGIAKLLASYDLIKIVLAAMLIISLISLAGFVSTKKNYFYWIMYSVSILITGVAGSLGVRLVLKEYQIMRLIVFLNPNVDPKGTGWNIIQSITAVGSGGVWGKGFLKGTQSHYRFLPQQSTDFIYSILAEEWGFIGSFLVLLGFGIILLRTFRILLQTKDIFGLYMGIGIATMIFFHLMVNIGMAIGIMPITGIPLFFLSYGGSSLWTVLIALGLLENIYIKRFNY